MKKIGLVIACDCEIPKTLYKYDYEQILNFKKYQLKDDSEILLAVTDPGKENVISKTEELLNGNNLDYIINLGFSGGAYPNAKIGDIIVAKNLRYHNKMIKSDKELIKEAISALKSENLDYKLGDIQVSDIFLLSKENIQSDVLAVDMESFHIAKTSSKYNTKFLIVRFLSDILSDKEPKYFTKLRIKLKITKGIKKASKQLDTFFKTYFQI